MMTVDQIIINGAFLMPVLENQGHLCLDHFKIFVFNGIHTKSMFNMLWQRIYEVAICMMKNPIPDSDAYK